MRRSRLKIFSLYFAPQFSVYTKFGIDPLLTWADLFDTCSFEAKKMIVAQFVKAVRVSRDYNIEIDFNVSFEEFQNFSVKNGEPVILQPLRSHTA